MPTLTPEQLFQLAIQHIQSGRPTEAIPLFQQLLVIIPHHPEVTRLLGISLFKAGLTDEALPHLRRCITLQPRSPRAYDSLAIALHHLGNFDEAIAVLRQALLIDPHFQEGLNHLGMSLRVAGNLPDAEATFLRLLQLNPNHPHAHTNLANVYRDQGRLDDAIAEYEQSIHVFPNFAEAYENLATALSQLGRFEQAHAAFQKALALRPASSSIHSNLIYTLCFQPGQTAATVHDEHLRWNAAHAAPLQINIRPSANDRTPQRRLRIGYVSPDFFQQAEAFFVLPLLESHDHTCFEIHCYSSVIRSDALTERFRKAADVWHEVRPLSNLALAEQIRANQIDILIDLTMHMAHNRLPLFAVKPAPIQITWLAYPGSTGLPTIDYRFTDSHMDPTEEDTPYYSEKSLRLPDSWCCYSPLSDEPPRSSRQDGPIRFGSLNNPCKMNPDLLALWSQVLLAVPDACLLLLAYENSQREFLLRQFEQQRIAADRIEFIARLPRPAYLRTYDRIDIALDTLPYNGITTTCDALWMGTPVVTLTGATAAGRAGASLLSAAGLTELITRSPEEFVRVTAALAQNIPRLERLRSSLRAQVTASPLMDAPRFARNVESAYRQSWQDYCLTSTSPPTAHTRRSMP